MAAVAAVSICRLHQPVTTLRLSSLALGATAAAAGLLLGNLYRPSPYRRPCESCNGQGYVECLCARWNAASGGCTQCGGSLRRKCPQCRGGGTAIPAMVPIPVRVRDGVERLFGVFIGFRVGRIGEMVNRKRRVGVSSA